MSERDEVPIGPLSRARAAAAQYGLELPVHVWDEPEPLIGYPCGRCGFDSLLITHSTSLTSTGADPGPALITCGRPSCPSNEGRESE